MRKTICLFAVLLSSHALTGRADDVPDLSGFWNAGGGRTEQMPELLSRIAPNTVFIDDAGATELEIGRFGGLDVKPAARRAAAGWDPMMDQTVATVCVPPSIIYSMQGPFPIEVHQGTELLVIKLEYFDHVRVVFLDGRGHPGDDYPHSKQGHSVGRWDGDILIVDTTHLASSTLTNNGLNHSDNVHLIERFRLSDDGRYLHATQEFEDPDVLDNRGARYMVFTRADGHVLPYECDPSYAVDIQDRER
jgi:hypothetical protein